MSAALINPKMLQWARERSRLSVSTAADKAGVKLEQLSRWESGEARPTFVQAQTLARVLHIPFGYLYLPSPPQTSLPVPDLRTVGDRPAASFSVDLQDVLADALRKQDWYRDHLREQGAEPLSFVGRYRINASLMEIARDITVTLKLSLKDRDEAGGWEEFLTLLIKRAEEAGVSVMRSGIVGSNTHRALDMKEFRGFALCDSLAPVVFLNGTDAKAAQIFTLLHELVHIWIGESGISNESLEREENSGHPPVEKFCNAVAAEVLVPSQSLHEQWKPSISLADNAAQLSRVYRVSSVVVARRALDLGLTDVATFRAYYRMQAALWQKQKEDRNSGGNYYPTLLGRNGRSFSTAVVRSALEHQILLRDAGHLLGISPDKLSSLASHVGIG